MKTWRFLLEMQYLNPDNASPSSHQMIRCSHTFSYQTHDDNMTLPQISDSSTPILIYTRNSKIIRHLTQICFIKLARISKLTLSSTTPLLLVVSVYNTVPDIK